MSDYRSRLPYRAGFPLTFLDRPASSRGAEAPRAATSRDAVNPAAAVGAGRGEGGDR